MRIGELDDTVGKEFAARRDSMSTELSRLGTRLAEGGREATSPAVPLADAVRISPEARALLFSQRTGQLPLAPFPSPVELVSALRDLASTSTPGAVARAAEQVATLIRRIAGSFPGAAPLPSALPGDQVADALVRAVLSSPPAQHGQPASPPPAPQQLANLVRQLLAAMPSSAAETSPGVVAPLPAERAAIAILLAVVRNTGREQSALLPPSPQQPAAFPAALLGLVAGTVPPQRGRNRERKRPAHIPSSPQDEEGRETPQESRREQQ